MSPRLLCGRPSILEPPGRAREEPFLAPADSEIRYHQCTICEAACGLEFEVSGRDVVSIRGDAEDAFSRGFICPKGAAMRELDADPDRLRQPLVRKGGIHVPVSWDEAFEAIEQGLRPIIDQHGNDAVAFYLGNPSAHSTALLLYNQALLTGFRTRNRYSAARWISIEAGRGSIMFSTPFSVPVPISTAPTTCSCSARIRTLLRAACSRRPTCSDASTRSARAAGAWWWSIRAAPAPWTTRASGSRSARARTPRSCWPSRTCSSPKAACGSVRSRDA
jgi:hypothetical protein